MLSLVIMYMVSLSLHTSNCIQLGEDELISRREGMKILGTTTGISAHDRALTARKLADSTTKKEDFNRPGHLVPLRAAEGGVLKRKGHTEASVGTFAPLSGLSRETVLIRSQRVQIYVN